MTRLNRGLAFASLYTKRTPAQAVNTAGLEIAYNAKFTMPFVTAARIDLELGTMAIPRIGISGRVLRQFDKRGKSIAKNKTLYGTTMGRYEATKEVPLTVLIIAARAKPGSKYNLSTGGRYALAQNPFKGFSRALGQFKMTALIDTMIKRRHSSGGFLRAGWTPAINALLPLSVNKWRLGAGLPAPPMENDHSGVFHSEFGGATPADENAASTTAWCVIENNIGFEGLNAASFNRALWEYGAVPLQRAVDNEGAKQMQYFLDKSGEELAARVNKEWA
jgi:hypothetical protein